MIYIYICVSQNILNDRTSKHPKHLTDVEYRHDEKIDKVFDWSTWKISYIFIRRKKRDAKSRDNRNEANLRGRARAEILAHHYLLRRTIVETQQDPGEVHILERGAREEERHAPARIVWKWKGPFLRLRFERIRMPEPFKGPYCSWANTQHTPDHRKVISTRDSHGTALT